jgi:hypothetical protein
MEQPTVNPENLLRSEAATVLDFASGPLANACKTPYLATWSNGTSPENMAEHGFGVMVIALAIHQLCRERDVAPYSNIDGTRIALQALTSSTIGLNNLFALRITDAPTMQTVKDVLVPTVVRQLTQPLAPCIAQEFETAWIMQQTNPDNPVSTLIIVAELIHDILQSLDHMVTGVRSADFAIEASLKKLAVIWNKTETPFKYVLEGMINTFCDLLGTTTEELLHANTEDVG